MCLLSVFHERKTKDQRELYQVKKYEIMYIVNANVDDAAFDALEKRLYAPITENGGSIDKIDNWGLREFAYEIDHMKKGHYVVVNVTANNAGIEEFERLSRINPNVIRTMVIKTEDEE